MLTPLVSMWFDGPSVTKQQDISPGNAVLGRPAWDPGTLLAQLELRMGLPPPQVENVVRLQRWTACLREVEAAAPCFYSRSYAADPLGTAKALLEWRDELKLAGWSGHPVSDGGPRLDALSKIERCANLPELAPGYPDRLQDVARQLEELPDRVFERLELAEHRVLWPALWRRAFARLEDSGVPVESVEGALQGSATAGDLALLQGALRGELTGPIELVGDGSVLWLEGETAWELGQAAAALLRSEASRSVVVVRGGDPSALDVALQVQGLPSQGWSSRSTWRPALQILPLALELAFIPRDPQRVFELLTLPEGPFRGKVGRELAKALSEAPGIGGRPWLAAKQRLRDAQIDDLELERIARWLEDDGHSPSDGAPVAAIEAIVLRVTGWLEGELTRTYATLEDVPARPGLEHRISVLAAALSQARAFEQALRHDKRTALRLVEVRQVLEEVAGEPIAMNLSLESAGRLDHVARPAAVQTSRDVVLWWYCAEGTEWKPRRMPWRQSELRALESAGVSFVELRARLAAEAASWLAPVFAARERLILASPRSARGTALGPHPLVDEIAARITKGGLARIHMPLRDWIDADGATRILRCGTDTISSEAPLPLPPARAEWALDPACIPKVTSHSASSLEALATCPLRWLLRHGAGLYPSANRAIPRGPMLYGKLGHRLVEELYTAGALNDPVRVAAQSSALVDRLVCQEASTLLCSGQRTELVQLKAQLRAGVESLSTWLVANSFQVVDVEKEMEASWRDRKLAGRVDLLIANAHGHELVLDLKWGASRYEDLLKKGMALQLAIYCRVRQLSQPGSPMPRSAYFCLSNGKVLTHLAAEGAGRIDGTQATWQRLEATMGIVERCLEVGRVPVTGVLRSLPLWTELDAPAINAADYLHWERGAACAYCDYGPICGRSWESVA